MPPADSDSSASSKVIRLQPSGKDVPVQEGDSVLSALERQGYALPNNCRAGACGECRAKVISGDYDQGMIFTMALSDEEIEEGYGLMCMAMPTSDVLEFEYGTIDAQPKLFPPRTDVPFVVVDKIPRTGRIVELRLRPMGEPLRYWPGQYLQLGQTSAGASPRCYSIANAPKPDGEISLLISKVEDGKTSSWVHDILQPGDRIFASGPFGTFVGDAAIDTPVVCLAAGSGLAPILALTDAALRRGFPHPVTLVFSAPTADAELLTGLTSWWEATHSNFKAITTFTRQAPASAEHTGRIPTILEELFGDLSNTSVFIAGSPAFVEDCTEAALALGAEENLVNTEGYVSQFIPESPPKERLL